MWADTGDITGIIPIVAEDVSEPTSTPTPSIEPTPTGPSIRFYNPYLIIFGSALLLVGVGILVYFKKYRK